MQHARYSVHECDAPQRHRSAVACPPRSVADGFSVVELLVVIAVLGVLLGIGLAVLRPNSERLAANSFRALLQEARTEAISRNRPVAVTWDADQAAMIVRVAPSPALPACDGSLQALDRLEFGEYRGVAVTTDMSGGGLVWLPNGRHRSCDPSGSLDSVTTFASPRGAVTVRVSTGGSVVVQ